MKVLMLVMNSFENDSRVHRAAAYMADRGHDVQLLCLAKEGLPEVETQGGYTVKRRPIDLQLRPTSAIEQKLFALQQAHPIKGRVLRGVFVLASLGLFVGRQLMRPLRWVYRVVRFLVRIPWNLFIRCIRYTIRCVRKVIRYAKALWRRIKAIGRTITKIPMRVKRWGLDWVNKRFPAIVELTAFHLRRQRYDAFARNAVQEAEAFAPDLVYAHDFNTLLSAELINQKMRVPFVYDSHELWVERNRPTIKASLEEQHWEKSAEQRAIRKALCSVTVCESIAEHLRGAYSVAKPYVIRNTPERAAISRDPGLDLRKKLGFLDSDFILVYLGIVAPNRGILDILDALARLPEHTRFVALGAMHTGFYHTFQNRVAELGLEGRVVHHPPVAQHEIAASIASFDLSLTTMNRVCLSYEYTLPNKLFESIQAGLPIVGPDSPEIIRVIEQFQCGLTYVDGNAQDLADKVLRVLNDDGLRERLKSGSLTAAEELCWEKERRVLGLLMEDIESSVQKRAQPPPRKLLVGES